MSTLRTFQKYGQTAAVNVFAYPCNLVDLDGNLTAGAAGLYFQFHDKATAPTGGEVPIKSYYMVSGSPIPLNSIFQAIGPVSFLNGLSFGVSTTDATYTAATATYDVFGEIDEGTQSTDSITGLSTTTASSTDSLQVWSVASGATTKQALYSVTITNAEGVDLYAMVFADTNAPAANAKPVLGGGPFLVSNGTTVTRYFGGVGFTPRAMSTAGVLSWGCTIVMSSVATGYTNPGGAGCTITAKSKAV